MREKQSEHRFAFAERFFAAAAIDGQGDVATDGVEKFEVALIVSVFILVVLNDEDAGESESVPELRLALVGAGADCAALGLRVRFQFGSLPAKVPEPVVEALCGATRAALNNVLAHAGTRTAWVTVETAGDDPDAITVDIVDRGAGFDPDTTIAGVGLPTAIAGRMAEAGGVAGVDSAPGHGTWVRLRWPA